MSFNRTVLVGSVAAMLWIALMPALGVGQQWQTIEDHDWCDGGAAYCEVREITLDGWDDVRTQATNGSIEVTAWERHEVRVTARIKVSGMSRRRARETVEDVEIHAGEGGIYATGPGSGFWSFFTGKKWSVSYRVMVPAKSDVEATTVNGAIVLDGIQGRAYFKTTNGGINCYDLAGDVEGGTVNGGIKIALDPAHWHAGRVDVKTTNGGIRIELPPDFSADVDIKTTNGSISVAHPMRIEAKGRTRLRGTIGDGGPLLRARTTNGGVRLARQD